MIELELDQAFKEIIIKEVEHVSTHAPIAPLLLGEPGIGKSSFVKSICEEKGWHFFELLCNQLGDRTDITGCRSIKTIENVQGKDEEIWKQIFFPHQSIQDAITCAKNHPNEIIVLFLDEINRTSSDITSAILSFTTARKVGTYSFPANVRFVVAGNDKGNITAFDSASISRFAKYKVKPSANTYMNIEENLNPYIKQVLTLNPSYIFCRGNSISTATVSSDDGEETYINEYETFDDFEGSEQITTSRTLSGLNAFLNSCDLNTLSCYVSQVTKDAETGEETNLLQAIVHAHVGQTVFADALCQIIAEDVSKGLLQKANTVTAPTKPSIYKDVMKCQDRQTRENMIANLSDDDKSAILLYAIWEKGVNNSDLITAVASQYDQQLFTKPYHTQFLALQSQDELDYDNYNALLNSHTKLGDMIRYVFVD